MRAELGWDADVCGDGRAGGGEEGGETAVGANCRMFVERSRLMRTYLTISERRFAEGLVVVYSMSTAVRVLRDFLGMLVKPKTFGDCASVRRQ